MKALSQYWLQHKDNHELSENTEILMPINLEPNRLQNNNVLSLES